MDEYKIDMNFQAAFDETQISYITMVISQEKSWPVVEFNLSKTVKERPFAFKAAFVGVKNDANYELSMVIMNDEDKPLLTLIQKISGRQMLESGFKAGKTNPTIAYLKGDTPPLPLRPGSQKIVLSLKLKHVETDFTTQAETWFVVHNDNITDSDNSKQEK